MEKNSTQEILTTRTDTAVSLEARERLFQDYEILSVTFSGARLFRPLALDLEAVEDRVLSSAGFREGSEKYRVFYLLKENPQEDDAEIVERALREKLSGPAGEEKARTVSSGVQISGCGDIPGWVLRNLLLGALESGIKEPERSRIGNGLTRYWRPGRNEGELTALNYRFDAEGVFHQNVLTFTALSRFPRNRKGEFLDQSLKSEFQYRFEPERKIFQRVFAPLAGEELYVRRRMGRAGEDTLWSSIPASESDGERDLAQRWKEFEECRLEEIWKVVRNFNETYEKYGIVIRFRSFEQLETKKTRGIWSVSHGNPGKSMEGETVHVINTDPYRKRDAEELAEVLRAANFRLMARIDSEPDPDGINLIFIHDREYRGKTGISDSRTDHPEFQYITYEAWEGRKKDRSGLAQYWLVNAWEKKDVLQGRITLTDCSMLPETMYFAKDFYDPNRKKHHDTAMRLEPDGTMEIACSGSPEFERCFPGWDPQWFRCRRHRDNAEYAVRMGSSLNLIRYTGVRALIPPAGEDEIREGPEEGGQGRIAVRTFRMDGKECFLCGIRYGSKGGELETGPVVREIIPIGESRILIEDLLPLMMVDSVRLNQQTVVPFPIRCMREYLRSVAPRRQ